MPKTPKTEKPRLVHAALMALADSDKAHVQARFFKTGKGQYAEWDRILGVTVPEVRQLARQFNDLSLAGCKKLLASRYNEERLLALLILVQRYRQGDETTQQAVFDLYVANLARVNNWNLVDTSAPYISGPHLLQRPRALLYEWIQSASLWERRVAVLSTFAFIRQNDFTDTMRLTESCLQDPHDLMLKACGWMLRELGKRDREVLEDFLQRHCDAMPRTMLRYAIERFPEKERRQYLKKQKG